RAAWALVAAGRYMEASVVAGIAGVAVVAGIAGIAGRKAADTGATMAVGLVADRRAASVAVQVDRAVEQVDWRIVVDRRAASAIAAIVAADPQ
ncbi:MAG TPA: hypothetical protein VGR88_09000, partial [Ktedonobacterales bacterium]|nr:hypothetical protein [Ktedonobacterales bacterium]